MCLCELLFSQGICLEVGLLGLYGIAQGVWLSALW